MNKILIVMLSVLLVACQAQESPTGNVAGNNNQDSGQIGSGTDSSTSSLQMAEDFMLNAPTYAFDGSGLYLADSNENGAVKTYTFKFESENTGFGDRSNKKILSWDVEHETIVKLDDGIIVSAITDNYWNEVSDELLANDFVTLKYQPVQCDKPPWELWFEYNEAVGESPGERPSDINLIEDFYEELPGTRIRNVQKFQSDEVTCNACDICLESYYYTLEVDTGYSAQQLEEDGWDYIVPLSKAEAKTLVEKWILSTPTYKNRGRNLESVIVYVDSQSPQRIIATYGFETLNGGYGSENLYPVSGINYHAIKVTIEDGVITEAIIDDKWDSLNQKLIG